MTAGLVLAALVVTAHLSRRRGPTAGYVLIAVSISWLLVDKSMEGAVLVSVNANHGLTAADLGGLAGIGLGLLQVGPDVVRRWRRVGALVRRR